MELQDRNKPEKLKSNDSAAAKKKPLWCIAAAAAVAATAPAATAAEAAALQTQTKRKAKQKEEINLLGFN